MIPTPALAEVLATPGCDIDEILGTLRASVFIRIGDFDLRAAVELATRLRNAAAKGDIREDLTITKSAMKFDRQIVAIALTRGARVLYSDDVSVRKFAEDCGLTVKRTSDLPVPAVQQDLFEGKERPCSPNQNHHLPSQSPSRQVESNSRAQKNPTTQAGGGGEPD